MPHGDTNNENLIDAEKDAIVEAEVASPETADDADTEDFDVLETERGADADAVMPAEETAIHADTESAQEASGDTTVDVEEPTVAKTKGKKKPAKDAEKSVTKKPAQARSAAYVAQAAKVDINRLYKLADAIRLAKETSYTKFDGSIEVHVHLRPAKGKQKGAGEQFRTIILLPHGSGKEPKIGVLDEAMIETIKQKGDTEFDLLIATPALMPKVAQIAKILGPKGKMPNPKTGTVTDDIDAAKKAILSGRVELRADNLGNIHQIIGKASWTEEKLTENYAALMGALPMHRLLGVRVCATMSPSIAVNYLEE